MGAFGRATAARQTGSVGPGKPILEIVAPDKWDWEVETENDSDANSGWGGDIVWNNDGDPQKAHFDALFGGAANNPFNAHTRVLHFCTGTIAAWPEGGPIEPGGQLHGLNAVADGGCTSPRPCPIGRASKSSGLFAALQRETKIEDAAVGAAAHRETEALRQALHAQVTVHRFATQLGDATAAAVVHQVLQQ